MYCRNVLWIWGSAVIELVNHRAQLNKQTRLYSQEISCIASAFARARASALPRGEGTKIGWGEDSEPESETSSEHIIFLPGGVKGLPVAGNKIFEGCSRKSQSVHGNLKFLPKCFRRNVRLRGWREGCNPSTIPLYAPKNKSEWGELNTMDRARKLAGLVHLHDTHLGQKGCGVGAGQTRELAQYLETLEKQD
jgi:hypothetical protein